MKSQNQQLVLKITILVMGLLIGAFALVWAIHKATGFEMGSHQVRDIELLVTSFLVFLISKFQKKE